METVRKFDLYNCSITVPLDDSFSEIGTGFINLYAMLGENPMLGFEEELSDHDPNVIACMQSQVLIERIDKPFSASEATLSLIGGMVPEGLGVSEFNDVMVAVAKRIAPEMNFVAVIENRFLNAEAMDSEIHVDINAADMISLDEILGDAKRDIIEEEGEFLDLSDYSMPDFEDELFDSWMPDEVVAESNQENFLRYA